MHQLSPPRVPIELAGDATATAGLPARPSPHPREVFGHAQPDLLTRTVLGVANRLLTHTHRVLPLEGDRLMARAEVRSGLTDWGSDFAEGAFDVLLASARTDARLNFVGRYSLGNAIVGALANWLRLVDRRKAHPELVGRPLKKPIVIAGPPRTGTTLLHHLLCTHPGALYLPMWWAMRPLPAPSPAEWAERGSVQRRAAADRATDLVNRVIPAMKDIHPFGTDLPVECTHLIAPAFFSNQWGAWPLYSYLEWLAGADASHAYATYRQHLQLMAGELPGTHWVLKSPGHFVCLEDLLKALPEATVVVTHRDPAQFVPSLNSMMAAHQAVMSDDLDFERMSNVLLGHFDRGARRYLVLREQYPGRILDIRYEDLVADPAGQVRRIHAAAGVASTDQEAARIDAFLAARPTSAASRHRYPVEQFGLTPALLRERFADYITAVGIGAA